MTTQTHADILKSTPPEPAVPAGKQVTPQVTPLSAIAGKVADAIKAQASANGATPQVATTPKETTNVPETKDAKDRSKTKLVQVNFGLGEDEDAAFRTAIFKAADDAQLSLAAWAKVTLAKAVNVTIVQPEKTPKTVAEKAVAKADSKLTLMLLVRNHMRKLHGDDSAKAKAEQAKVDAYIKKLSELEGVGADKAKAILEATEEATS
jgi:hypothetical protein